MFRGRYNIFIHIIVKYASCAPQIQRLVNSLRLVETKKAWEFLLLPIPDLRPSHCPYARISNAASPRQVII